MYAGTDSEYPNWQRKLSFGHRWIWRRAHDFPNKFAEINPRAGA